MAKILVADDETDLEALIHKKFETNQGAAIRICICHQRT